MKMADIKEFLTTATGTEGSLLIEKKIYDILVEAVEKKRIGRELAAIYIGPAGIPGSSVDIDLVTADSMAVATIAEGAAVPIETVNYTSTNLKPVKYGVRPLITKEMQEDGKWDLMEHNIKIAGTEMGENEDGLIVTALASAANTITGAEAITLSNISRAMQYLEDSDYTATDIICGPEVANDFRNIDIFQKPSETPEMMRTGFIGTIFGCAVHVVSANILTSTYCYMLDRNHAFAIAEKRPVSVERYDDVTHDLSGAVVTQRITVKIIRTSAVCLITTT